MRELTRSALVSRSPQTLYRLVEDVERYPEFVPGCTEARVLDREEHQMLARLSVRRGPLHTTFTTRNELDPGRAVFVPDAGDGLHLAGLGTAFVAAAA